MFCRIMLNNVMAMFFFRGGDEKKVVGIKERGGDKTSSQAHKELTALVPRQFRLNSACYEYFPKFSLT